MAGSPGLSRAGGIAQRHLDSEEQIGPLLFSLCDTRRKLGPRPDGDDPTSNGTVLEAVESRGGRLALAHEGQIAGGDVHPDEGIGRLTEGKGRLAGGEHLPRLRVAREHHPGHGRGEHEVLRDGLGCGESRPGVGQLRPRGLDALGARAVAEQLQRLPRRVAARGGGLAAVSASSTDWRLTVPLAPSGRTRSNVPLGATGLRLRLAEIGLGALDLAAARTGQRLLERGLGRADPRLRFRQCPRVSVDWLRTTSVSPAAKDSPSSASTRTTRAGTCGARSISRTSMVPLPTISGEAPRWQPRATTATSQTSGLM